MAISERIRCMEGVPVHPALWVIDDVTPQFRGFARGLLMTTVRRAVVVLRDGSHGAQRPRLDATARSAREKLPYKKPVRPFPRSFFPPRVADPSLERALGRQDSSSARTFGCS